MSRAIPFPVLSAPTATRLLPNRIPAEGTLRRCPHGQYLGALDGEASPYCILCGGTGNPIDARPVVLPRSSGDPLDESGRVYANKKSLTGCPECGSHVWLRVDENGGDAQRECADCGTKYRRVNPRASLEEQ